MALSRFSNYSWLAILVSVVWLSGCGQITLSESRMLENARVYFSDGAFRSSVLELKNILQKNPRQGEARYLLGRIYFKVGDYKSAEQEFRKALDSGWDAEKPVVALAETLLVAGKHRQLVNEIEIKDTYSDTGRANLMALQAAATARTDPEKARQVLQAAAAIQSDAYHVLRTKAGLLLQDKSAEAALDVLAVALSQYPDSAELLLWKAQAQKNQGDKDAAESSYRLLLEKEPKGFLTMYGRLARLELGQLLIMENRRYQVEPIIRPLLTRNPQDIEANYLAAVLALKNSSNREAEILLRKILAEKPDHIAAHLLLGTLVYEQQKFEQAAFHLQKYVSADSGNTEATKLLARTYLKLGQGKKANTLLQRISNGEKDDSALLALTGLAEIEAGRQASGVSKFRRALQLAPENSELRQDLATALLGLEGNVEAIDELKNLAEKADRDTMSGHSLVLAYIRNREFDKARQQVDELIKDRPDNPAVLLLAGSVDFAQGDLESARRRFSRAIKVQPDYLPASMLLARLELQAGNAAQAGKIYLASSRSNPDSVQPLLALAALSELEGDLESMRNWLEKARRLDAGHIESRLVLAEYYLAVSQIEKARQVLDEAAAIDPLKSETLQFQARLLMAQGQYEAAMEPVQKILAVSPDNPAASLLLAQALIQLDSLKDARSVLSTLIKQSPDFMPAILLAADVEVRSSQYSAALELINRLNESTQATGIATELQARALAGQGNFESARKILAELVASEPTRQRVILLSEVIGNSGDKTAAIRVLTDWLKTNPEDMTIYEYLGFLHQQYGDNRSAIKSYARVLKSDPGNKVILNNFAWLLYLEGEISKALRFAKRAYQIDPDDPGILDTYGWLLVTDGQAANGKILLQKALQQLTDVPEVRYHYAVAVYQAGQQDIGLGLLQELLQTGEEFPGRETAEKLLASGQ